MSVDEKIKEIDTLHNAEQYIQVLPLVEALAKEAPDNLRVQLRLSRAMYNHATNAYIDDKEKREAAITKALEIIKDVDKKSADDFEEKHIVKKYVGITLSGKSKFLGTKEKIGLGFEIQQAFEQGVKLAPADATLRHCLGMFYYNVWNLSFIERGIASVVFQTPPSATFEQVELELMKSYELNPKVINNLLGLGQAYYANSDYVNAKRFFKLCSESEAVAKQDEADIAEAKKMLAKC